MELLLPIEYAAGVGNAEGLTIGAFVELKIVFTLKVLRHSGSC
ncbi:hypothetical protein CASFOL_020385 [Castilleja foliolosa]|uniref:Uncharacterized protein n=1 Tax=Castilleja foliolosa TaxID=1961234 RepID=A0ABD3D1G3_9LAMI